MEESHMADPRQRRAVRRTVLLLVLVVLGFYFGFMVMTALR